MGMFATSMCVHHIVPRHMGGTDAPDNLQELTVVEHAEAHRLLWEEHKSTYDYIAWKALSGQITMSEASYLAKIEGCKKGALLQPKESKVRGGLNNTYENRVKAANARYTKHGHIHSNISGEALKRYMENKSIAGRASGLLAKENKTGAFARYKCVDCGYESTARWIQHHLKKAGHSDKEAVA